MKMIKEKITKLVRTTVIPTVLIKYLNPNLIKIYISLRIFDRNGEGKINLNLFVTWASGVLGVQKRTINEYLEKIRSLRIINIKRGVISYKSLRRVTWILRIPKEELMLSSWAEFSQKDITARKGRVKITSTMRMMITMWSYISGNINDNKKHIDKLFGREKLSEFINRSRQTTIKYEQKLPKAHRAHENIVILSTEFIDNDGRIYNSREGKYCYIYFDKQLSITEQKCNSYKRIKLSHKRIRTRILYQKA